MNKQINNHCWISKRKTKNKCDRIDYLELAQVVDFPEEAVGTF